MAQSDRDITGRRIGRQRKKPKGTVGDCRQDNSDFSLLDLKACLRGYKYVEEVWKLLPPKPDPISWAQILVKVSNLGSVHPRQTAETSY
ncbi:hypothetical protein [Pleurocapsa sp. PCC 7319]|uniref:hypothetical protein n=1 Tax=Pleurocapsa sp. PCC 7319 TaxID=118161 RepID=UPI000344C4BD|nr:hypothetical protein [Pleurocapsa sp. PCC 7319]